MRKLSNEKKGKIIFCYFHPVRKVPYTPLDIGSLIALLKNNKDSPEYLIASLAYNSSQCDSSKFIRQDIARLQKVEAKAIFFFLENVYWSKMFAFGRAMKIARALKEKNPHIFIGFQSYKIQREEIDMVLSCGVADCVVMKNPEYAFRSLDKILQKREVAGTAYWDENKKKTIIFPETYSGKKEGPDFPPSAYLEGVLDQFLLKRQVEFKKNFTAFLYSSHGCPFKCFYCFRGTKNEQVNFLPVDRFYDEIEYLVNHFEIIRFCIVDDVFLAFPSRLRQFVEEFEKRKIKNEKIKSIRLTAMIRPELLSEHTIPILRKMNVGWIQIGLQTIKPELQSYMNRRNLSLEKLEDISRQLRFNGILPHLDIVMGLPHDTVEYFKKTLDFTLKLEPCSVQISQFFLNPDTHFYKNKHKYGIRLENRTSEFSAPCVCKAAGGIDKHYFKEASGYVRKKMQDYPRVRWMFHSRYETHMGPATVDSKNHA